LDLLKGSTVSNGITFTGSGGELVLGAGKVLTAVISGFTAGDSVKVTSLAYHSGATVSVKSAGVVTISSGAASYNLNIAGATVGETDFNFGSGSLLTKTVGSAAMVFLKPAAVPAAADTALPAAVVLADIKPVSAAVPGWITTSAVPAGGFTGTLETLRHGGVTLFPHAAKLS
jgi:hypothetical protein